ncbi:hypothetical protein PVAND_014815 [Polypedilum vanderplanki]|uniref:Uncharacterized protein n=1 Tax=Polypedilum vanderplanki TaxID=319348 RepID=A0A9J6BAU1_POLVA|nr:hypothetical protein PVAND_014815 [Polypedilum vanderplanki]
MTQKSKLRKSKRPTTLKSSSYNQKTDESFTSENQDDQKLPVFDEVIINAYRLKNYQRCIKLIERILKFSQPEISTHYMILLAASYTMTKKNFKKSHQLLDEVLKLEPNNSFAFYGKGVAFYFDGQFENSLRFLNLAIEVDEPNMERAKNLKLQVEKEMTKVRVLLKRIDANASDDLEENIESFVVSKSENLGNDGSSLKKLNSDKNDDLKECAMEIDEELSLKIVSDEVKNEEALGNDNKAEITELKKQNDEILPKDNEESEKKILKSQNEETEENFEKPIDETKNKDSKIEIEKTLKETEGNSQKLEVIFSKIDESLQNIDQSRSKVEDSAKKIVNTSTKLNKNLRSNQKTEEKCTEAQNRLDEDFDQQTSNSQTTTSNLDQSQPTFSDPDNELNSTISSKAEISFDSSFVISSPKTKGKKKKNNRKDSKKLKKNSQKTKKFSKNLQQSATSNISNVLNSSLSNSEAQQHFTKGLDFYMTGDLNKAIEEFTKVLELETDFEEADEMITKSQEILDLNDVAEMNMSEKNYAAVVEILNQALEIDESNDFVNRNFYFQRGLAFYHLNENENSMKDYEEYERLSKKLGMEIKKVN